MKVVLAALNAKYVHSNLAIYDLEAYVKAQPDTHASLLLKEYTINHNLNQILQNIYQEKADVVAFSCYIWNAHEILTIAKELKKISPNTRIWLGGPEVSYDSEKLLLDHTFIEGIILGEGEITFYELMKVWGKREHSFTECKLEQIYSEIKGIAFLNAKKEVVYTLPRPVMKLDEIPFIYKDLSRFTNRILYYETSRGCPFSCSYCLSSIDKQVRFRSMEIVEQELQFFLDHMVTQVKFIDRTFNCKKSHANSIWRYLLEHDNGITNFHFEVAADLIGEEELELFKKMRPGLIQLEIGLQSTNIDTIKEIRRTMDIDRLKKNMLTIKSFHNIHQHLDLIAGLPYEDFVTFKKSFNEAYAMRPDQLQLGFLKVLKGSYMGEQIKEYGLLYQEVQPYEVLCTKWISYDEILELKKIEEMVEVYHNSAQFEHVLKYLISLFDTPFDFFECVGNYYERENLYDIGFKREARYEVLREFAISHFISLNASNNVTEFDEKILDDLLTFDYYLRENAKSRPSWSKAEPIEKKMYTQFFRNGGTEELVLTKDGYDSKVAARMMHIEPICEEAAYYIFKEKQPYYCLFDYEHKNPLSRDARVMKLRHL